MFTETVYMLSHTAASKYTVARKLSAALISAPPHITSYGAMPPVIVAVTSCVPWLGQSRMSPSESTTTDGIDGELSTVIVCEEVQCENASVITVTVYVPWLRLE